MERTSLPSGLMLRLFGSIKPINNSCCCNKPVVLQIFYSNLIAITISWFDFLPLLQSLHLFEAVRMGEQGHLFERKESLEP